MTRPLVFIPTYNERENVEAICSGILDLDLQLDLLFLDDNSPDGTGQIIDQLAQKHSNISVIHRKEKSGIGSAHQEGLRWAYDHGYTTLITMDADHTHPPHYIPDFIKASKDAAVVVGSRHLREDSLKDWDPLRLALTKLSHIFTSRLLKMPHDATGAYRLYQLDKIPRHLFDLVQSKSYSFFFESLYLLHLNSFPIKEVPIILPARARGHSKMALRDAMRSGWQLLYLYAAKTVARERLELPQSAPLETGSAPAEGSDEWDKYWLKRKAASGLIFDIIAAFYRKFIIKRTLNHFIFKYFQPGAELLHAGCGGGQVDVDVTKSRKVTALDISMPALKLYERANAGRAKLVHGDIFAIPLPRSSVDGIYNLGVMEHFAPDEIQKILQEFHRVLRPEGKIVLFWPPRFGLSVMALDSAHFILNRILRKNVKLHPDEITRVRSARQMRAVMKQADFELERFYFGPMDFFTHAILVAKKR